MRQAEKFESADQDGITQAYLNENFAGRIFLFPCPAPENRGEYLKRLSEK
jgi:hypothetical protein